MPGYIPPYLCYYMNMNVNVNDWWWCFWISTLCDCRVYLLLLHHHHHYHIRSFARLSNRQQALLSGTHSQSLSNWLFFCILQSSPPLVWLKSLWPKKEKLIKKKKKKFITLLLFFFFFLLFFLVRVGVRVGPPINFPSEKTYTLSKLFAFHCHHPILNPPSFIWCSWLKFDPKKNSQPFRTANLAK